jgi:SAM-dependent methyltransferase
LGRREMLKVRQKYGIRRLPRDGFFGMLVSLWVSRAGHRFAYSGRSLPGALPGAGYDYNDFWGGVLRRSDLQRERNEQNPIGTSKKPLYDPICPTSHLFPDRLLFSITSIRNARVLTSDIYIIYRPRTAIILPSIEEQLRQLKKKSLDNQVTDAQLANDEPNLDSDAVRETSTMVEGIGRPALKADRISIAEENQIADQIIGLTRGLVSESEEIAFLEVGCYTGDLLDALKARTKWKLFGIEANPSAATEAISKGHQVFEATLEEAPGLSEITKCFHLIYLGQRIERFDEPGASLRRAAVLLNPGGFLILSTPNLDSEQLKLSGPAWPHWKPEYHRFIYSPKSLKRILARTGFHLTRLWTVSNPDATALSLRLCNNGGTAAVASGEQTEVVRRSCDLARNRLGKGDVIFAICRRIS